MLTHEELRDLTGATAYDQNGGKIGTVTSLYWDTATQMPEWLTVKTGLFGMKETFVPLALAKRGSTSEVTIATDKDIVTGAPKIDPDGQLSQAEEQQLYAHYGLDYNERHSATGLPETGGQPGTGAGGYPQTPATAGGDDAMGRFDDDAMTRSEEQVRVGTTTEQTGRVRLRKYVVTEQVQQTVPVSHEEVRVEREPITEANRDQAMAGPDISEAEHEVTLHHERPVVEKEAVPVERVRLGTETVPGEETVSEQVRKEQIDTDGDGDTGIQR
jgi:uncharacterized protein (TIGR02271 family)